MLELATVGLGNWARRLVRAVQGKSKKVRFRSAVVTMPSRSQAFADEYGITLTTDYGDVLRDPEVAGVVSSGPAHLHAQHSLMALEAGKPVLAVKQMALTAREGRTLEATAKRTGLLLALGYNRCFFPNVGELRRRLTAGSLGEILHCEGNFCVDRYGGLGPDDWQSYSKNAPAGALADHMLYLMIETMGPIAEVDAHGYRGVTPNDLSDVTGVLLRTRSGKSGLLTAIGTTPDYYRFHAFGTKGWVAIHDARELTYQPLHGEREHLLLDAIDAERAEIEAFADALTGVAPYPVPLENAIHSTAVIEAMGRSADRSRPVTVESE